jgi:hypothetical protein
LFIAVRNFSAKSWKRDADKERRSPVRRNYASV